MNFIKFSFLIVNFGVLIQSCKRNTLDFERYHIACSKCNVKFEKSIDSYAGTFQMENTKYYFDYGYYSSNLVQSEKEYLDSRIWLFDLESMLGSKQNNVRSKPLDIKVINIRPIDDSSASVAGGNFIATCSLNDSVFKWKINLPEKIKNHIVSIDTCGEFVTKLVVPKIEGIGFCGFNIYNIKDFNTSLNSYKSLSIYCKMGNQTNIGNLRKIVNQNFNCDSLRGHAN